MFGIQNFCGSLIQAVEPLSQFFDEIYPFLLPLLDPLASVCLIFMLFFKKWGSIFCWCLRRFICIRRGFFSTNRLTCRFSVRRLLDDFKQFKIELSVFVHPAWNSDDSPFSHGWDKKCATSTAISWVLYIWTKVLACVTHLVAVEKVWIMAGHPKFLIGEVEFMQTLASTLWSFIQSSGYFRHCSPCLLFAWGWYFVFDHFGGIWCLHKFACQFMSALVFATSLRWHQRCS